MTAALPPDPADVLTRLEELHQAATADGPWRAVDNHEQFDPEYRYEILDDEGTVAVCTGDNDGATATTGADRSALIEAAVNNLPALLAAVRGVLALAEEMEGMNHRIGTATAGDLIRAAVTAALGETGGGQ